MVFENYFIISLILTVTPGSLETSGNTSLKVAQRIYRKSSHLSEKKICNYER